MFKTALIALLVVSAIAVEIDTSVFLDRDPTEIEMRQLYNQFLKIAFLPVEDTPARYAYFTKEVMEIINHNRDSTKTWTREVNQFTGFTLEELTGHAIMTPQNCSATNEDAISAYPDFNIGITEFDWRLKGIVSPVKNQGKCGSCWTFSTTGALESHWALHTNSAPLNLSEQQLIDCAGDFNNHGCNGGLPSQAFEYIRYNDGIDSEDAYPYLGVDSTCKFNKSAVAAKVYFGSYNISQGDETALTQQLVLRGPVSIAFQVTKDFTSYKSGVYTSTECGSGPADVNHAVLAVGFGYDPSTKLNYWIVKNSWGESWGNKGYFWIQKGVNMCGVATCASFPNLIGI